MGSVADVWIVCILVDGNKRAHGSPRHSEERLLRISQERKSQVVGLLARVDIATQMAALVALMVLQDVRHQALSIDEDVTSWFARRMGARADAGPVCLLSLSHERISRSAPMERCG
jgi:hypothetical protein